MHIYLDLLLVLWQGLPAVCCSSYRIHTYFIRVQVMLDYIIAFAALGLAGFSRKNILWGIAIGGFGRFFSSFLSGVIFFGSYAPEGMNPIVYSILVNGLVLGTDSLICLVVCLIPRVQHMIQSLKHSVVSN